MYYSVKKSNKFVAFRATPQMILELDQVSKLTGETRSTVIRSVLMNFFNRIYSNANDN